MDLCSTEYTYSKTSVGDKCEKGLNLVNVQFVYETDEQLLMKFVPWQFWCNMSAHLHFQLIPDNSKEHFTCRPYMCFCTHVEHTHKLTNIYQKKFSNRSCREK